MRIGKTVGILSCTLGLGIVIFALLAIVDPQDAQLANDADPLGTPPSTVGLLLEMFVGAGFLGLGAWFVARRPRK